MQATVEQLLSQPTRLRWPSYASVESRNAELKLILSSRKAVWVNACV